MDLSGLSRSLVQSICIVYWGASSASYFVPLVVFAFRRMITPQLLVTLIVLLILGAAQGLLGWYMVKSGLVDRPSVSSTD